MAITYTEQGNLPPIPTAALDAASLTADGEGMHSLIPHDLVRGLNNLGTYVNPHVHYVQGASLTSLTGAMGVVQVAYTGTTRECFMLQIPLLCPLWAKRMVWTVGATCTAVSLSTVKVYMSRDPYTGVAGVSGAFDTTKLGTGYRSRSVSVGLSAGSYGLADDSSTGITPIDSDVSRDFNPGATSRGKRGAYAIVTATGGTNASLEIDDCSFWFLPT